MAARLPVAGSAGAGREAGGGDGVGGHGPSAAAARGRRRGGGRGLAAGLGAEMAWAATPPPLLLQGDAVEVVADAFARVPVDALPVVTTTWALSHFPLERRLRFLHRLHEAAARRAAALVAGGGVGVTPTI